ncbi:DNA-binding protein WhiA [Lagierella sp.]|uniref:DNA-binding protein WhiA n=1 Tax=Lagierella sp. TaxID=2849657 RepID=UPI0026061F88|nr:DNA-binding protein WhiA [Lagierella sp.]
MSFSTDVKNEISRQLIDSKEEAIAELAGLYRVNGSLLSNLSNIRVQFSTETNAIARRIFINIKKIYNYECVIEVVRGNTFRKNNLYKVYVDEPYAHRLLSDIKLSSDPFAISVTRIPKEILRKDNLKKSYILGSFLGAGSVTNPEKGYHLELIAGDEEYAKDLYKLLKNFNIEAKIASRKDDFFIYLKEGESIADFLSLIGAFQSMFKFEDIRVFKEIKNNVNRVMNFESANMDKTIEASIRHVEDIEKIMNIKGLDYLNESLREIAVARLEYPEDSLKQLGERLDPPVGKSGVNHRLKKIHEIAEGL